MEGNTESQMISAEAFVEGGIQDSCNDACCICLEEFCASDPSTVTNCKHEFHLHCILEWCQRNSQCPMCWQSISLKDPTSQQLFEAVEQERKLGAIPSRNATFFHHPDFSDFALQHLRMSVNDVEFEDRIIQQLAVAAATRRANQFARREVQRTRSSGHGHPHLLVITNQIIAPESSRDSVVETQSSSSASGSTVMATNRQRIYSNDRGSSPLSSPVNQDRAEPSEFQSHSDSLRSRFNAVSMRYKESIAKGARGWRERFFCRSCSMSELGSETRRREMNAEIASVSRLKQSLETSENNKAVGTSSSSHMEEEEEDCSIGGVSNQNNVEASGENSSHDDNTASACSASSNLN